MEMENIKNVLKNKSTNTYIWLAMIFLINNKYKIANGVRILYSRFFKYIFIFQ